MTRDASANRLRMAAGGGAALLHAVLLAPLGLGALGLDAPPPAAAPSPPIEIALFRPARPLPHLHEPPSAPPPGGARAGNPRRLDAAASDVQAVASPTASPDDPPRAPPPAWPARAGAGAPGWSHCPNAIVDPAAQRLCNERDRLRLAQVEQRRAEQQAAARQWAPAESEGGADEGFARTAAANRAWRDYTRGDGAYPGLRSLFRDH